MKLIALFRSLLSPQTTNFMMALFGGVLADAWVGKFWVIFIGAIVVILVSVLLWT